MIWMLNRSLTYSSPCLSACTLALPFGLAPGQPTSSMSQAAAFIPFANGMATAADWMSAASFISMAGHRVHGLRRCRLPHGLDWWVRYFLALLLAPYLRKFGQFTVPDFIGTRYYSTTARVITVICLILVRLPTSRDKCAASVSCSPSFSTSRFSGA